MSEITAEKRERLFVGVPVTAAARERLLQQLPTLIPGKAVPAENWHFTLKFLGSTEATLREKLIEELRTIDRGAAFEIEFNSLGAFPGAGRARVVWVGTGKGRERLESLAEKVEHAAVLAGFEKEKRRFKAHLTIARVDPPRSVARVVGSAAKIHLRMRVDAVAVYRSELGRPHSRYVIVDSFPLGVK